MSEESAPVAAASSTSITTRARGNYDAGQLELLRSTVAKDLSIPEFGMFLEVCARYELDPFTKQIYPVKIKGVVQPVISRDGLLGLADRHADFRGVQSNVVHEFDHFDTVFEAREDDTMRVRVDHRPRDKDGHPTHGGRDGELRGPIIGAWARCRREGHDDTYFFAYRKEYDKRENVWLSHPHAMMQKVPEAMVIRKAYAISGVLGEAEVPRTVLTDTSDSQVNEALAWPEDEDKKRTLEGLFETLGYTRAKVRLKLAGADTPEKQQELIDQLNAELDRADLPHEPITDADVVEDSDDEAPAAA